ncbi:hypothetical protein FGADI_12871 [Fusarium gaditjirri]|uniref:Uncharacterized protein n=1 Tax=Fusarium gaditjirri TaxID=282569 RepID=A0A8H4SR32_9HYPO|nr:hypothetical protein FGADI_12871 [Fusarium gaditjirri]
METTQSHSAISAIDGLLACLIYPAATGSEMTPTYHGDLCHQIDRYWDRLRRIMLTQTTPSPTALFNSFHSSTQFIEIAIFTFRNVLVGAKPNSLNAIFSLCSLSYIASCCLRNHDNFRDIDVWRDAIRDPQERRMFSDLAGVVWPQVSSTTDDALIEFDFMLEELLFSDVPIPSWELEAIPESSFTSVGKLLRTSSSLQDLQGSAIMSNLISFLTECGDVLHVFSGRGVTTKDLYSCIAFTQGGSEAKTLVNSCVQRLKSDDASQNPPTAGIISIVERFIALGYLQTPEELRKYMLCVGRVSG